MSQNTSNKTGKEFQILLENKYQNLMTVTITQLYFFYIVKLLMNKIQ